VTRGNVHGAAARRKCGRGHVLRADARPRQVLMHRNTKIVLRQPNG
jgi:hypothetical protein